MRLSSVIHLYRVRLRARIVQEALALAGIAVGVALVFAALVASTSLTGSVRDLTDGVIGNATLQVAARGADGFDERTLARVERIDGVRAAAPVAEIRANVVGPDGRRSVTLIGGDARFARLGGTLLSNFSNTELGNQQAIALPGPLAQELGASFGETLRLEVDGRVVRIPLSAQLQPSDIGSLVQSPVALMPLAFAQRVGGMRGRVTRIFVESAPGRQAEVRAALLRLAGGRLNVRSASADVAAFEQAAYPTNRSTMLFSVLSALVGFLFAFSAMLLTVPQRRRLIADLRTAGHGPWVLVQLLLFDALVLGVAGSLTGLALGDQMSRHLFNVAPDYLTSAFPVGTQRVVSIESVAIAGAAGAVAASIAVLAPLHDVLRRDASRRTAEAPSALRRRLAVVAGIACVGVTTAIVVLAPDAAVTGIFALTFGLVLLLPSLLRGVTRAFAVWSQRVRSPVPLLAIIEIRSRAAQTRTLAVAATGAVAVFATVAIGGAYADLQRGLNASAREIDGNADMWITFDGPANTLATTPFRDPRLKTQALRGVRGVEGVHLYRGSFLDVDHHRAWVLAPPRNARKPIPPSQIQDGDVTRAAALLRRGGWVALSEAIAAQAEVGLGDRVTLPSPVSTEFRVAAITTNLGWPPGAIVLNADDYRRAWRTESVSAVQLDLTPGASPRRVKAAVERELGPGLPFRVETRRERTVRHYATARDGLSRMRQIGILVVVSAILAMTAAMGGMIWQRRRTIAALKVHGYPETELWRALLLESTLILGTGCLIGAAFGLYGQVLLSRALETVTGFPVFYVAAVAVAAAILAVVTLVAVAMLALPGWLAVRVRPAPGVPR